MFKNAASLVVILSLSACATEEEGELVAPPEGAQPLAVQTVDAVSPSRAVVTFSGEDLIDTSLEAEWFYVNQGTNGSGWGCGRWHGGDSIAVEGLQPETEYTISIHYVNGEISQGVTITTPALGEDEEAPIVESTRIGSFTSVPNVAFVTASDASGVSTVDFLVDDVLVDTYEVHKFIRQQDAEAGGRYHGELPDDLSETAVVTAVLTDLLGNKTTVQITK